MLDCISNAQERNVFIKTIDKIAMGSFIQMLFDLHKTTAKVIDVLNEISRDSMAAIILDIYQVALYKVPNGIVRKRIIREMTQYLDVKLPEYLWRCGKRDPRLNLPGSLTKCYQIIHFKNPKSKCIYREYMAVKLKVLPSTPKQQHYVETLTKRFGKKLKKPIEQFSMYEVQLVIGYFSGQEEPYQGIRTLVS